MLVYATADPGILPDKFAGQPDVDFLFGKLCDNEGTFQNWTWKGDWSRLKSNSRICP